MESAGKEKAWKAAKERVDDQLDALENENGKLMQRIKELERKQSERGSEMAEEERRRFAAKVRDLEQQLLQKDKSVSVKVEEARKVGGEVSKLQEANRNLENQMRRIGTENKELEKKYKAAMVKRAEGEYRDVANLVQV